MYGAQLTSLLFLRYVGLLSVCLVVSVGQCNCNMVSLAFSEWCATYGSVAAKMLSRCPPIGQQLTGNSCRGLHVISVLMVPSVMCFEIVVGYPTAAACTTFITT